MTVISETWLDFIGGLSGAKAAGYGSRPFHDKLDDDLTNVVRLFECSTYVDRRGLRQLVGVEHSFLLLAYSERMASLAIHERSDRRVVDGLLAIAIEDFRFDARDALIRLALLHRSAEKLSSDPQTAFDTVASLTDGDVAAALRSFTRGRRSEDRTIEAMGYRESTTLDSPLVYERTW